MRRRRFLAIVLAIVGVGAGLVVHLILPDTTVTDIAGDALYPAVAYLLLVALLPRRSAWFVGAVALAGCVAIELFQLTGLPLQWAQAFPPIVLVLGTVFDPRDLVVYTGAVLACTLIDLLTRGRLGSRPAAEPS